MAQIIDHIKRCATCGTEYPATYASSVCEHDAGVLVLADVDKLVGSVITGRYKIFNRLGAGGWGTVYLGSDLRLNRAVAIKILDGYTRADEISARRFEREALIMSRLVHPNIVTIYDRGVLPSGQPFMVMEYLDGATLDSFVDRAGRIPILETLDIVLQICSALEVAHTAGVIHRDLKPQNIIIQGSNLVKILDFGLAKQEHGASLSLTKTGATVGSPSFMSPEQCRGEEVDARSDIYSLGLIMYRMLTGVCAFEADTIYKLMHCQVMEKPKTLSATCPDQLYPEGLEEVVQRCLEKETNSRFSSCAELEKAVESVKNSLRASDSPVNMRSSRRWQKFAIATRSWRFNQLAAVALAGILTVIGLLGVGVFMVGAWLPGTETVLKLLSQGHLRKDARVHIFLANLETNLGNTAASNKHAGEAIREVLAFARQAQSADHAQSTVSDLFQLVDYRGRWRDENGRLSEGGVVSAYAALGDRLVERAQAGAAQLAYMSSWQLSDPKTITIARCDRILDAARATANRPDANPHAIEQEFLKAYSLCCIVASRTRADPWVCQAALDSSSAELTSFYERVGRFDDAIQLRQRLISRLRASGRHDKLGQCLYNLGVDYIKLGRIAEAETSFREADKWSIEANDDWSAIISNSRLAELYLAEGKIGQADACATKAMNMAIRSRQPVPSANYRDFVAYPIECCAAVYQNQGKLSDAESVLRAGRKYYQIHKLGSAQNSGLDELIDHHSKLLQLTPIHSNDLTR